MCVRERERGYQVTEWNIIGTDSLNCRGHRTFRSRKYRYIYDVTFELDSLWRNTNVWLTWFLIKSNHLEYAAEIMINNNDACLTWDTLFRSVNRTRLCWNNSTSIICVWIDSSGSAVANISATFHWWPTPPPHPPSKTNFKLNANSLFTKIQPSFFPLVNGWQCRFHI